MFFQYYPFYTAFLQQCTIRRTTTSSSTNLTSLPAPSQATNSKFWRHLVFDFGPTTAETQIPWTLSLGAHFRGAPFAPLIFYLFGARGSCPLLPIFKATPPRTHAVGILAAGAWGFHNNFFLGPPHLHNVVGRPPKIKRHLVFSPALTCNIW